MKRRSILAMIVEDALTLALLAFIALAIADGLPGLWDFLGL